MGKRIRPDEETIQGFRALDDMIGANIDNIVEDFSTNVGLDTEMGPKEQHFINVMFTSFVLGMINTMSPQSNFNRKFNHDIGPIKKLSV